MLLRKALNIAPLFLSTTILAGCVTTGTISKPTVEPAFRSAAARSTVQRYVTLDSRTTGIDADGRRVEIADVPCRLAGRGFHLAYSTPANVRIPVYGHRSADLSMTCRYKGKAYAKTIRVFNETKDDIENAGAQGGFIGSVIMMTYAGARGDKPNDKYTYVRPHLHIRR